MHLMNFEKAQEAKAGVPRNRQQSETFLLRKITLIVI